MSDTPPDTGDTGPTQSSETNRSRDRSGDSLDANHTRNTLNTDVMQWVSAVVALIGLYIAGSPFLFEATEAALWSDLVVGLAIFLLAGYNFYRLSKGRLASVGAASLVVLLGLWALVSPYIIDIGSDELAMGTAVSGLVVAALSAYNAYANNKAATPEPDRTTART